MILKNACIHIRRRAPFFVVASIPLAGCNAQALPDDWQVDCVGRMQISFPDVAEVASVTPDSIIKSATSGNLAESFFSDGKFAPYSAIAYFGPVDATGPLTDEELAMLRTRLAREAALVEVNQKKRKDTGELGKFAALPTRGWDGKVWDFGTRIRGRLFIDRQYYAWRVSAELKERTYLETTFKTLMAGLAARKNFTLPTGRGVCMAHFFVSDTGSENRKVTTTYRLRSHPDVTIVMEDANADDILEFQNPDTFTAKAKTNFFWTQRYQSPISRKALSNDTIKFAGQEGLETKIKLSREGSSEDYGYSVFTRGDPNATQDTPDLMLVLIRNAADAKAKGRTPISEDAFFSLAKRVAASVKPRPVAK